MSTPSALPERPTLPVPPPTRPKPQPRPQPAYRYRYAGCDLPTTRPPPK